MSLGTASSKVVFYWVESFTADSWNVDTKYPNNITKKHKFKVSSYSELSIQNYKVIYEIKQICIEDSITITTVQQS